MPARSASAPRNDPATTRDQGLVCVIEDEQVTRKLVVYILQAAGFEVRSFRTGEEFLDLPALEVPHCLFLDFQLPGRDGLHVQKQLKTRAWTPPIIFLTSHATVPLSVKGLKAGAFDFLLKPCDRPLLIETARAAMNLARHDFRERADTRALLSRLDLLTVRENEVLLHLVTGALNKEIAVSLGITERTVKAHRRSIMDKMRVTSLAAIMWMAGEAGLRPSQAFRPKK